jgi:hypothetical protein
MANSQPPDGAPAGSAGPENNPPENPQVNDTWVDTYGDLYTWDGTDWAPFEDIPYFEPNSPFRYEK